MWAGDLYGNERFLQRNFPYFMQTCLYLWGHSHGNSTEFPTIIHFWMNKMLGNISLCILLHQCLFLQRACSTRKYWPAASSWASREFPPLGVYSPHLGKLICSLTLLGYLLLPFYSYRYGSSGKTIWEPQVSASYAYYRKSEFSLPPFLSCKILPT